MIGDGDSLIALQVVGGRGVGAEEAGLLGGLGGAGAAEAAGAVGCEQEMRLTGVVRLHCSREQFARGGAGGCHDGGGIARCADSAQSKKSRRALFVEPEHFEPEFVGGQQFHPLGVTRAGTNAYGPHAGYLDLFQDMQREALAHIPSASCTESSLEFSSRHSRSRRLAATMPPPAIIQACLESHWRFRMATRQRPLDWPGGIRPNGAPKRQRETA